MKKHLLLLLLFLPIMVNAWVVPPQSSGQQGGYPAYRFRKLNSEPATCTTGDVYYNISTAKNRQCLTTNTWSDFGSGSGSGTVTGTGTTNIVAKWTGTSTVGNSRITDNGTIIDVNSGAGSFQAGDGSFTFNGTAITLTDSVGIVDIQANGNNANRASITLSPSAASINAFTGATEASLSFNSVTPSTTLTAGSLTIVSDGSVLRTTFNHDVAMQLGLRTASAANTDLAGLLTIGAGGTVTYTFTQAYTSAPVCVSSDTNAAPNITGASASTTVLTVTGTVGHVVSYICIGRN